MGVGRMVRVEPNEVKVCGDAGQVLSDGPLRLQLVRYHVIYVIARIRDRVCLMLSQTPAQIFYTFCHRYSITFLEATLNLVPLQTNEL